MIGKVSFSTMVIIRIYFQKHKDYRFSSQTHMRIGAFAFWLRIVPRGVVARHWCNILVCARAADCQTASIQPVVIAHIKINICAILLPPSKEKKIKLCLKIRVDHYWFKTTYIAIPETVKTKHGYMWTHPTSFTGNCLLELHNINN